jgi:hypothetical protein
VNYQTIFQDHQVIDIEIPTPVPSVPSRHEPAHKASPSLSRESIRCKPTQSIDALENIAISKVIAHRAISWLPMKSSTRAFETMVELGLRFDCSAFSNSFHWFGLLYSPPYPYRIAFDSGNFLTKCPAQVLSIGPLRSPRARAFFLRSLAFAFSKSCPARTRMKRILRHGLPSYL